MTTPVDIASCLTDITRMYHHLWEEAAHRAGDARDFPGGDAMNLLGPAANLEAWQHRYETAEDAGFTEGGDYVSDQIDTEDHPLLVLATWEDAIRDQRDQPTDQRATVERAAKYIRDSIDWMFTQDDNGDYLFPAIDALIPDLRRVRSRLENVLHDGVRHDRGVPCMTCRQPLTKVWGKQAADDRWVCQTCATWSTPAEYNLAVAENYRSNADKLTASDMETEYRIKPGTLRKWVSEGKVTRRGFDGSGRQLYDVEQAKAQRDKPQEAVA